MDMVFLIGLMVDLMKVNLKMAFNMELANKFTLMEAFILETGLEEIDMVMADSSGFVYSGQWKNDLTNGYGIFTFDEGGSYRGEFKDSLQNGTGKNVYSDGGIYIGKWVEGNIQGNGSLIYSDEKT